MKNVVLYDTGKEIEFKPNAIFRKYLNLVQTDLKALFKGKANVSVKCPACKSSKRIKAFVKFGYSYYECKSCRTVYLNPRPKEKDLKDYYFNSKSARYWRGTLSKATQEKRKEKIYKTRLQWIVNVVQEYMPHASVIADFNSKNKSFIEEFLNWTEFKKRIVVDPYFNISRLFQSDDVIEVVKDPSKLNMANCSFDVACAFEVIDNHSDVDVLLKSISTSLKEGGLCFLTTISISGFDMQVLWGNSENIFPMDRINVFSNNGLEIMLKRHGFEIIEFSTPGLLDIDKVKNAIKIDPTLSIPRFVKTLIERDNEQMLDDFQEFLQINKLSSFVRLALKKK